MTMWDSVKEEEEVVFVKTEGEEEFPEGSKRKRVRRTEAKKRLVVARWSAERYRRGEQRLLEMMKSEGARFEKPMSRSALRVAARSCIGDTGLLDHLLKHIEGKATPGGTHRVRRWFNTAGVMEYWLEDAQIPQDTMEVRALRDQVKQLSEAVQSQQRQVAEMFKDVIKWKAETNQHLNLVLSSWKTMQDMFEEMMANAEQPWEQWLDLGFHQQPHELLPNWKPEEQH